MALTTMQLASLITETKKARQSLDKVLDYADLMSKYLDDLPADLKNSENRIRGHASEIEKQIEEIRYHVSTLLNNMPIDPDEVKNAADKLLLYQGDISQVINWAESQKRGHEVDSYWWRYWQAVSDIIKEQKGK